MTADATTRQVVAQVARELDAQVPALTAELAALFLEQIPAFQGDEAVRELMAASTSSNLSTIFDVLLHGLPLDRIDVPAAAAAYARRFAQRDLPIEGLLRAYRLGQERVIQWLLRRLGTKELAADVLLACAQEVVSVIGRYIDQVSEHLLEIYETERKLWTQRTDAARAVALRTVLDDDTLDLSTAEAMIGYRMRGWHIAAVAWVEIDTPNASKWAESAAGVLAGAHGGRPLAVLADDHTLWAWLSGPPSMRLDEQTLTANLGEDSPLRITLGEPAAGLAGFRSSHREALRAKTVAETSGEHLPAVLNFARVSIAAMLSEDLDALRTWVARTLGELARDDEGMARLRETVRIFLETGGSFTDAAARLHLHKNTVHYRVRKAEEIRGRPLGDGRLDVEVALVACQQLGHRVLLLTG
ncbi:MAG TPA: helix-turn-helix domain-containing protein [Pseudonocardia sp.]|nr:helix-turn-helix domain-containing protein [Pseudonocardia sp.]